MKLSPLVALLLAIAGSGSPQDAAAQWQWRDDNGRMVFSDRPPPASVPATGVVRTPGRVAPTQASRAATGAGADAGAAAAQSAPAAAAGGAPGAAPASAGERDLELRRRRAELADKEKHDAQQRAAAERQARACDDSRAALRALDSGMRVARINAEGEREFLSDEERGRRAAELRRDLQDACKAG